MRTSNIVIPCAQSEWKFSVKNGWSNRRQFDVEAEVAKNRNLGRNPPKELDQISANLSR